MARRNQENDLFEAALRELRGDDPDPSEVAEVAQRVRERIFEQDHSGLRGCEDYRRLLPALEHGDLSKARMLLLQDHLRHCVYCRNFRRSDAPAAAQLAVPEPETARRVDWRHWGGMAAGVVLMLFLLQLLWPGRWMPGRAEAWAVLEANQGPVYSLLAQSVAEVQPGDRIEAGVPIRTSRKGGAFLRLPDGSRLEASAGSQLSVRGGWGNRRIILERGQLIVQAAAQGSGRLLVETPDCTVVVQGTIFSVNHGINGSRVSVLEGQVKVRREGRETLLTAGSQYASAERLKRVPVAHDIAWSQNLDQHLALLQGLASLQRDIQQVTLSDSLRHSSALAHRLPENTFFYAAFPNLSHRLQDIRELFLSKMTEHPALREWYGQQTEDQQSDLEDLLERARTFGAYLGSEIVVAAVLEPSSKEPEPVLLAEVTDRSALEPLVEVEVARLNAESDEEDSRVHLLSDPFHAPAASGFFVLLQDNLLVLSPSLPLLRSIDVSPVGAGSGFVRSHLHETVSGAYQDGVDWVFAADLGRLSDVLVGSDAALFLNALGFERLRSLLVEKEQAAGLAHNRAVLSYEESGAAVTSWLAPPGPMGGLDFVSPDAFVAASFVISNPVQLIDNILGHVQKSNTEVWNDLLEFESSSAVDLRQDLAAPLGGEVVVALDGPILPEPSWKLIVEVYDSERLQGTIERIILDLSRRSKAKGEPEMVLSSEVAGGIPVYSIGTAGSTPLLHYLYRNGYLIAATNRPLLGHSLQAQHSGYRLAASSHFTSLLPRDSRVNPSGIIYANFGAALQPFLQGELSGLGPSLNPDQEASLRELIAGTDPSLISFYSQPGRITLNSTGEPERMWMHLGLLSALAEFNEGAAAR